MVVSLMETPRERFDDLYQQYFPKVYSYFSICFGADTAQDLSQITFLKVWDFLRQPHKKLPDHFRAWIFRVAVNVKNDYLRKKQRIPQQLEYEETYSGQGREMESQTVESLLVEQTLSKLHPGERELLLFKHAGLTSEEIGRIYGISPSTVRSRMSIARTHFQKNLEEYGVINHG